MSETPPTQPRIAPWTLWIPIIIMALGVVVFFRWVASETLNKKQDRPPYAYKLERDLELIEKTGKPVKLSQLKGKVILAAHFYSTCPSGCTALADKMMELRNDFRQEHPSLQLVSFAIDEGDTPERLSAIAKESFEVGPEDGGWWFVNGDQKAIRNYLTLQFKFITLQVKPEKERTSPIDKYNHDMRIALVDHEANVRGLYDLMSPDLELRKLNEERLRKHLAMLLKDAEGK